MTLARIKAWLAAPFAFTSVPVTILTVVLYGFVFASVFYTDTLPDVPKHTRGLDLNRAYEELHQITARPHPYISHANDDIHSYLLSRLRSIASAHPYIHISDDLTSNASYVEPGSIAGQYSRGVYFEGTNILVKIDGTDEPLANPDKGPDGVLFSAHYDSVSTSPGATDDGMGVVTLLELVRYFADPERRPRRTSVFFFNNGEEDGLNGAHVYFEHPWSNLTSTFINLEGAASGGRPLIFRSTSLRPVRAFHSASHPHAEVISADAFARGVIRSGTDYQVYERGLKGKRPGMNGVDFAFYKNRAYYHTPRDSIPGMGRAEGKKALWAMLNGVRDAGLALLNEDALAGGNGKEEAGVYFDMWGRFLISFSVHSLFVANIVLLTVGPLVLSVLLGWLLLVSKAFERTDHHEANGEGEGHQWPKAKRAMKEVINWGRFWIALLFAILANSLVVLGYRVLNPYVIHSHYYLVLFSFLSLSYLTLAFPLQILHKALPSSPSSQKLAILLEFYFLTWILLVISTVAINKVHIGGAYWVTLWNATAGFATFVALLDGVKREKRSGARGYGGGLRLLAEEDELDVHPDGRRRVRGIRYDAPPEREADEDSPPEEVETEPTEITPLFHQRGAAQRNGGLGADKHEEHGWWILQMGVLVPLSALLVFKVAVLLTNCLNQTLVDGNSPGTAYAALAALCFLTFIPITPFAHKLGRWITFLSATFLILTLIVNWTVFPFNITLPYKVYFQQKVELEGASFALLSSQQLSPYGAVRATTHLTGIRKYVQGYIIPELPSSWGKNVTCVEEPYKPGLHTCSWESDLLPSPGGNATASQLGYRNVHIPFMQKRTSPDWLKLGTKRRNATSALISLKGTNTRACRLYFDKPIYYFHVLNDGTRLSPHHASAPAHLQPGYEMPEGGIQEVRLWSRTWDKDFDVHVAWDASSSPMRGRAACEWAEYASGTAGRDEALGARSAAIPAFEELKQFLPLWVLPTKMQDGLVEAWTEFSL